MIVDRKKLVIVLIISVSVIVIGGIGGIIFDKLFALRQTSKEAEDYLIIIDLTPGVYRLFLFEDKKLIREYKVAGGKYNYPSPLGVWKIISKDTWGEGFGGRWMGLNVPWGIYGIHGTKYPNSIGWGSSHGCIRMLNKDVRELYSIVPHGTKVVIIKDPYGPFGSDFKPIKPGDRGSAVYAVQKRLKQLGYYKGYIDGIYGDGMKSAVIKFKKDHNLWPSHTITVKDIRAMGFILFE